MNKSQLIEALAKAENITLKKAEMVVNAVFENMADARCKRNASKFAALAVSR